MTDTKRLILNITEELHTRLKTEAAQKGVSLGSHCAAILGGDTPSSPIEEIDLSTLTYLSLDQLREHCRELVDKKPNDWKRGVANVNTEMRRRFRT